MDATCEDREGKGLDESPCPEEPPPSQAGAAAPTDEDRGARGPSAAAGHKVVTCHDTLSSLSDEYIETHMVNKVEVGCVKWFNNKVGYGFITVKHDGKVFDIFVHHSAIQVRSEQYRYLVQGEYVQFKWSNTKNRQYKWNAVSVCGIGNGPLMCETRNETRAFDSSVGGGRMRGEGHEPRPPRKYAGHSKGVVTSVPAVSEGKPAVTNNRFVRKPRAQAAHIDSEGFQTVGARREAPAAEADAPPSAALSEDLS